MDCPFANESRMIGAALCVDETWYWCIALGEKRGTVVAERCGFLSDKTPVTFRYDQIDSII